MEENDEARPREAGDEAEEARAPVYIVQKCAPLRGWKKFIHVEKVENFTVQKNIICSATGNLNPIFYIYWGNEGIKYCVMQNFCHFE